MIRAFRKVISLTLFLLTAVHAQQYGWQVIARPTTYSFSSVFFVDTLHGVAGAGDGSYYTTDGGKSWGLSPSKTFLYNAFAMVDSLNGWVVGDRDPDGGIAKTTNGGITWTILRFVSDEYCYGTAAKNMHKNITTGWVRHYNTIYDTAIILQSTTSGATWQRSTPNNTRLGRITSVDSLHCWIGPRIGGGPVDTIFRTTDGGASWQKCLTPGGLTAISFLDTLRGWGMYYQAFFRTRDGGVSWDTLNMGPIGDGFDSRVLFFADTLNGWAFGDQFYKGTITESIYRTTDGGLNWYQESVGLTGDLSSIEDAQMLDRFHGWAVTAVGAVLAYRPLTAVVKRLSQPAGSFTLGQNYPNPFNPTTMIEYELPKSGYVSLEVYDITGKEVRTLVNQHQESGVYRVAFDAKDLPSGTYIYTLSTGSYQASQRCILIK